MATEWCCRREVTKLLAKHDLSLVLSTDVLITFLVIVMSDSEKTIMYRVRTNKGSPKLGVTLKV